MFSFHFLRNFSFDLSKALERYHIREQTKSLTIETSNCVNFQHIQTKFLRVESFIVGEFQISYLFYNLTYSIQIKTLKEYRMKKQV